MESANSCRTVRSASEFMRQRDTDGQTPVSRMEQALAKGTAWPSKGVGVGSLAVEEHRTYRTHGGLDPRRWRQLSAERDDLPLLDRVDVGRNTGVAGDTRTRAVVKRYQANDGTGLSVARQVGA